MVSLMCGMHLAQAPYRKSWATEVKIYIGMVVLRAQFTASVCKTQTHKENIVTNLTARMQH